MSGCVGLSVVGLNCRDVQQFSLKQASADFTDNFGWVNLSLCPYARARGETNPHRQLGGPPDGHRQSRRACGARSAELHARAR
jgi:hypothetical protein